eukprot:m.210249 g.210249  ORF g.210249 m.210249 type:complete len:104 (+) comp15554_c1_seq5:795-1106(+)
MSIWPASKSSLAYLSITLLFFLSLFLLLIPLHGRLSGSELGQPVDQCIPYLSFFLPANCTKDMLALLLYLFINLLFIDSALSDQSASVSKRSFFEREKIHEHN